MTASQNMETDERLALGLASGEGLPTVRVYGWRPWAVSLGWNQSPDEIEADRVHGDGLEIIRRPTGGRAVLHATELTYAVVMQADGRNAGELYRTISGGLLAGIRILGVDARLEARGEAPGRGREGRSAACFVATARSEIVVGGRKLVGSAQRRYGAPGCPDVILQHGSVLLGNDHLRIVEYLRMPESRRAELRRELTQRSTDVATVLGRTVTFDEAADAVRRGFEEAWGMRFTGESSVMDHETATF